METQNVSHGNAHHAEGVIVSQILLDCKRQLYDVVNAVDILRADSVFIESFFVKSRVVVGVSHYLLEFFTLQSAHFIARHAFHFPVPNHSMMCVSFQIGAK
jgi:hypothetical protein